jgi:putative addiction module killer protein
VEARPREILIFETADNKTPFTDWLDMLERQPIHGIIMNRLDRVEDGLFGDCEPVGEGVSELKIDKGPGYRVYFGQDGDLVVLLHGGMKNTQPKDIKTAKHYWRTYNAKEN